MITFLLRHYRLSAFTIRAYATMRTLSVIFTFYVTEKVLFMYISYFYLF